VHRDHHVSEWPSFAWPERWRRMFDLEGEHELLRVEEFQEGDTLVVRAEIPGIDPEKNVQVTVDDRVVRIHARREEKAEHKGKRDYRSEFRYGEFERDVRLPEGASGADVKASYHDGILEVRIPCPAPKASEPVEVPVSRN